MMGAEIVRKAMESCGLPTRMETFSVPGFWPFRLALVIAIFFLSYLFFRDIPLVSFSLYVLNMVLLWGELTFSLHAVDKFLFRHKSINAEAMVSAAETKPKTVIVMAHHDSPRTGSIYPIADRVVKLSSALPPPLNRFFMTPFAAALLLGPGLALRQIPGLAVAGSVIAIIALVLLGATALIILDVGWSRPSAGANDNGSGLLVLMELGRRLAFDKPANADIRLLATGAEESGFFGIKDYLERHKSELPAETLFINLECIGAGTLHWATGEEHLNKIEYNKKGIDLIDRLEKKDSIPGLPKQRIISPTDAGPVKAGGFDVITMIGLKDGPIPANYHQISDTFDKLDPKVLTRASDILEALIRSI